MIEGRSNGLGIAGVTTIVFTALKCVGVVSWSWWWVLSPLWISFGIGISFIIFATSLLVVIRCLGVSKA